MSIADDIIKKYKENPEQYSQTSVADRIIERYRNEKTQPMQPVQPQQSFLQKTGGFVTGTVLPFVKEKAISWGKAGEALLRGANAQYLPEEQKQQAIQDSTDVLAGGAKNLGELASGTGRFIAKGIQKANEIMPTTASQRYAENKGITMEEANNELGAKIDNSGVLNYKPEYKNEYQKTGGEIAEIGSWFIPVTRIGKIGKIEKALSELPKVAEFLGATPKIIKSGGKLFYEVAKDTADITALDIARGKDWETIKEDLKAGAIGAGVLRGVGAIGGAILKSSPTKIIEKSIGKLSDEEVKLSEGLLKDGKTIDDVSTEILKSRESGVIPETTAPAELTPRKLEFGELVPIKNKIESQVGELKPSQILEVKSAIEAGHSEESIIKSLQDTGEVTPKIEPIRTTKPVDPVKVETPIQTQKVDSLSKNAINSLENEATGIKPGAIERAKTEIQAGTSRPIQVREIDGKPFIEDGRNRLQAYKELGIKEIPYQDVTSQYTATEKLVKQGEAKATKTEVNTGKKPVELTYQSTEGTSGLAKSVKSKAIKDKMIYGFDKDFRDLPTYEKRVKSEDMAKATDFVLNDYQGAEKVIFEGARPPKDMLPEDVFVAMNAHATATKDIEMIRRLANESGLTGEATLMGQRIQALSQLNPDSALSKISEVTKARSENIAPRAKKVVSEIKETIKKVTPTKQTFADFVESIKCK